MRLLFYTVLSRVNSPSWPAGAGFMAVISVGLFGLGAMGGGTMHASSSPPRSEDDEEDESERRLAFAAAMCREEFTQPCAVLTSSGAVELDLGRLPCCTGEPPEVKPSSELCRLPPPERGGGSISEAEAEEEEAQARAAEGESERHLRGREDGRFDERGEFFTRQSNCLIHCGWLASHATYRVSNG